MKRFDPGIAFAQNFIQEKSASSGAQSLVLRLDLPLCPDRQPATHPCHEPPGQRPAGNPKADKPRYYLLTHGSHLVDTARFLGGEMFSVQARLAEKFGAYCWFVDI